MDICAKCVSEVNENSGRSTKITCVLCKKAFHNSCVTTISRTLVQCIAACKNYFWCCDDCIDTAQKLLNIAESVNDLKNVVNQHTKIIEEQNKVISELKTCINKPSESLTPVPSSNKRKYSDLLNWADEMPSPIIVDKSDSVKRRKPNLNNNVVKDKSLFEPVLIVKPDKEKNIEKMKKDISKIINPKNDPVKKLRQTARGNLVIQCNDHSAVELIKSKLNTQVKDSYNVDRPKETKPVLKLVGIHDYTTDKELLECIFKQNNEVISDKSEIELLQVKEIKMAKGNYHTAYIRCDTNTFKKIMMKAKLYVSWDVVKCYESINVLRCFKCNLFGHKECDCESEDYVCPKCSGKHKLSECKSDVICCANCERYKKDLNLDIATDHYVWSETCSVLQRRTKSVRNRIRYAQ